MHMSSMSKLPVTELGILHVRHRGRLPLVSNGRVRLAHLYPEGVFDIVKHAGMPCEQAQGSPTKPQHACHLLT